MSKILITGGAGFIGSHLCQRLLSDGHEVICVDNFISGSKANIEPFLANPQFKHVEFDITRPLDELDKLCTLDGLTHIFHFACPASPNPESTISYMAHPIETMMVSSLGSKNMLDLAKSHSAEIIFASTSEVYGDPLVHPQKETYWGNVNSTGPRSCYDEGKRFMEALAFSYYRTHQTKIKVVRIFNTYGPHMRLDDGRFTINLIDSYINHKPFKMYGNGEVTRSFCYIDDLVSGIMAVHQSDKTIGEVINLGNPTELTLSQAIFIFEEVAHTSLAKEYLGSQIDDPKKRQPDITKAKTLLGWEPKIDFAKGIKQTLDFYQKT
jgi:nucleoside-diphosphate-sugar epimerase